METVIQGSTLQTLNPVEKAPGVLEAYARWSADLPDEMTSGVAFLNVPPLPALPEPLRGDYVFRFNRNIAPSTAEH